MVSDGRSAVWTTVPCADETSLRAPVCVSLDSCLREAGGHTWRDPYRAVGSQPSLSMLTCFPLFPLWFWVTCCPARLRLRAHSSKQHSGLSPATQSHGHPSWARSVDSQARDHDKHP